MGDFANYYLQKGYFFFVFQNRSKILFLCFQDRDKIKLIDSFIGNDGGYHYHHQGDNNINKRYHGVEINGLDTVEFVVYHNLKRSEEYRICREGCHLHSDISAKENSKADKKALGDEDAANIALDTTHGLNNANLVDAGADTLDTEVDKEDDTSEKDKHHRDSKEVLENADTSLNEMQVTNLTGEDGKAHFLNQGHNVSCRLGIIKIYRVCICIELHKISVRIFVHIDDA